MANSLETLERQRAEILRQMQQWEICDAAASWNSICAVASLPAVVRDRATQAMGRTLPLPARWQERPRRVSSALARFLRR